MMTDAPPKKRARTSTLVYQGYVLPDKATTTTTVQLERVPASIDPADFYRRFIVQRRPCILENVLSKIGDKKSVFPTMITSDLLQKVAGKETVQVERRFAMEEAFGQNRTVDRQVQMTVSEFVSLVVMGRDTEKCDNNSSSSSSSNNNTKKNPCLYYLSTQQQQQQQPSQKDNSKIDDEPEHHFLFTTPCRQLLQQGHIPAHIPWAGPLVLQSCNLWMGSTTLPTTTTTTATTTTTTTTTTSGLHHDFHDNWYIVFAGRKTFRLYAPVDYECMELYGTVQCLHPNGLISYKSNLLRADGIPVNHQDFVNQQSADDDDGDDEDEDDDEEEVVIGKGFDYQDDEDDDDVVKDPDFDGRDDYDELVGDDGDDDDDDELAGDDDADDDDDKKEKADSRPDSFSRIDLMAPKAEIAAKYPNFARCREAVVSLGPGECLYVPASWFHCVTSQNAVEDLKDGSSSKKNNGTSTNSTPPPYHLALNYWYFPPDQLSNDDDSTSQQQPPPYADTSYWARIREEQAAKIAALTHEMDAKSCNG